MAAAKDEKARTARQNRIKKGIRLSPSTQEYLLILGDGNLSLGIEKAVGDKMFSPEFREMLELRQRMGMGTPGTARRRAEG